ncbi:MAG: insulinase family protein, partial [Nevskiaceae bacterium]|nr:insulinase family protein [Nevskiaceae bacterium]
MRDVLRALRSSAIVATLLIAAACSPAPKEQASLLPEVAPLPIEQFTLPNGLQVVMVEDRRLPLVAVNLWYHVGPANEKPGRTGFAHLFEHMMFQASKNVPPDSFFPMLEGAGASEINGTTSFDRTNYYETVPSNQLELALWLESDRMGWLLETLDQDMLTNQQDVVRNERRQSYENRPYGLVDEAVFHNLFPKGHPYYGSIIGSHADIEAARLGDVREFFTEYYAPNNATLVMVGDIDKAATRALVEKYFGPIPAGKPVPKPDVVTPPITEQKRVTVTDQIELPRITISWLTPPFYQAGDADLDMFGSILGGGKSSRLYQRLVYNDQIAQSVSAGQGSMQLTSVFQIEAVARPGVTLEQLEKAIDEELTRLQQEGPTQEELDRARTSAVAGNIRSLETFLGVANRLNQYNHYLGTADYLSEDLARYDTMTTQSVREAGQRYLQSQNSLVVLAVAGDKVIDDVPRGTPPKDDTAIAKTPPDWRATPPAAGPERPLQLPVAQRFSLPNGLTVMLFEQHNLPVIAATLVMIAGSDQNPLDRPGLASFTAALLDEGTATRSGLQIAEELEGLGAAMGSGSSTDTSSLSLRMLTPVADAAFAVFSDVLLHPAFAPEEIERARTSRQTQLVQQRENPTAIAQRLMNEALYGGDNPYGFTELGTAASLAATTREDIEAFWKAGYRPGNAALVVAGDITQEQLRALAEKHLGKWEGAGAKGAIPGSTQITAGRTLIVDRGASPQTALRVGMVGLSRATPDYVPLQVMNNALGGLFASRINLNLRERNGFTYGASSGFAFRRGAGPFQVGTNVRTDVTAPAVREIFSEIERMRNEPVTAAELELARDSLSRSLPGQFETTGDSAATGAAIFVYDLPLDYYSKLPAQIDAVSIADVQRVAKQYLLPEKMVTVAVG